MNAACRLGARLGIAVRPVGDRGALVELPHNDAVHRLVERLRAQFGARLIDVVAGHRTVLVTWRSPIARDDLLAAAEDSAAGSPQESSAPAPVTIAVAYDGPDLDTVARLAGISREAVASRHQAALYRVAFLGFAPGFAYLVGGDPALRVERRKCPRTRVPECALALAGDYTAIYPAASPGGWQLIGIALVRPFDASRTPPALLQPGAAVRFRAR